MAFLAATPPFVNKKQMETITGVTPSPDIAFVRFMGSTRCTWEGNDYNGYRERIEDYSIDDVVAVIEAKVASDGGTARQKCDEIRRQFARVAARPGVLAAALVGGSGWNGRRAEVSRLALDIGGQIYTIIQDESLATSIRERSR